MTDLIEKQLGIMLSMFSCGLAVGLVVDIFRMFYNRFFRGKKMAKVTIGIIASLVISYFIGEYSYFCQNGKITLTGGITFFVGLLLWYKYFYDIIPMGDYNEQKR